jgi:hypothetical protein
MASNQYAHRLARLERQIRCPRHNRWLYCACDELFDIDRLTEAEGDLLLQLAEKAGVLGPTPTYTPCTACGEARHCPTCDVEGQDPGLTRLADEERETVGRLLAKGLTRPWPLD